MTVKLNDLAIGDIAEVIGYEKVNKQYRNKLLSMGLTRGAKIKVIKFAPLGDPIEIQIRGFSLSLRKDEADVLILKRSVG